jgi:RNA-directed DNA polymerase
MSKLLALQSARTLEHVAFLLGFKASTLAYVLYKAPGPSKYTSFSIPKRFGGSRLITAPAGGLKTAQHKLSGLLQDCVEEIDSARKVENRVAHGFVRRRSIITNAERHRHRRFVFNIDLRDFFPSINFGRVRGYFMKQKGFNLDSKTATILAQIACYDNALPQGSPCSPVISNLIAHVLDMYCVGLAAKLGCRYTRYADDLTFSTNKKLFPAEIATPSPTEPHLWQVGSELSRLIKRAGFSINPRKTHMQYRDSRQEVTGLVVNRKVNVRCEYRHNVRAMVHSLLSTGSYQTLTPVKDASGAVTMEPKNGTLDQLNGMLGFIGHVDLHNKQKIEDQPGDPAPPRKEILYRKFLLYRDFYVTERPVIICEGETDNIYLIHAIRSLAAQFPSLATADGEKITVNVRLYKHSGSRTARLVDLGDGGSASLTKFIGTYHKEVSRFTSPGGQQPVVIVYDNDAGASGIKGIVKQFAPEKVTGTEPFVRIIRNLYVVPTPLKPNSHRN